MGTVPGSGFFPTPVGPSQLPASPGAGMQGGVAPNGFQTMDDPFLTANAAGFNRATGPAIMMIFPTSGNQFDPLGMQGASLAGNSAGMTTANPMGSPTGNITVGTPSSNVNSPLQTMAYPTSPSMGGGFGQEQIATMIAQVMQYMVFILQALMGGGGNLAGQANSPAQGDPGSQSGMSGGMPGGMPGNMNNEPVQGGSKGKKGKGKSCGKSGGGDSYGGGNMSTQKPGGSQSGYGSTGSTGANEPMDGTMNGVTTVNATSGAGSSEQQAVLNEINAFRASQGLPPAVLNPRLNQAAQNQSTYMAQTRNMTHTGAGGSRPSQRVTAAGYNWRSTTENVAYGQRSPKEVVQAWIDSPGHRDNLMLKAPAGKSVEIGVSLVRSSDGTPYWTQVGAYS